jgi:hypothetical protein
MKVFIPCPCGSPDHPSVEVYKPDTLHPKLADFVSDVAGFTYGSAQAEPVGVKGEIDILWQERDGEPCEVWDAVFDGEHWRNAYRWGTADDKHAEQLRAALGPAYLEEETP